MILEGNYRIEIETDIVHQVNKFYILDKNTNELLVINKGKDSELYPYKKIKIVEGLRWNECTFTLPYDSLQSFMDALWNNGYRPKEKRYENEIDLLKNHLQDMRQLVFENNEIIKD